MPLNAAISLALAHTAQTERRIAELRVSVQKLEFEGKHAAAVDVMKLIAILDGTLARLEAHVRAIRSKGGRPD
jgi:hypothetical protein